MSINAIIRQIGTPTEIVQRGFVSGTVAVIANYHILVGQQMITTLSDTKAPIDLAVDSSGGVAGLSVSASLRDLGDNSSYLDFTDNTFKNSGWTTKTTALSEIGGGFYSATIDLTAITNFPSSNHLVIEYSISGSVTAVATGLITISQTWNNPSALTVNKFIALGKALFKGKGEK